MYTEKAAVSLRLSIVVLGILSVLVIIMNPLNKGLALQIMSLWVVDIFITAFYKLFYNNRFVDNDITLTGNILKECPWIKLISIYFIQVEACKIYGNSFLLNDFPTAIMTHVFSILILLGALFASNYKNNMNIFMISEIFKHTEKQNIPKESIKKDENPTYIDIDNDDNKVVPFQRLTLERKRVRRTSRS